MFSRVFGVVVSAFVLCVWPVLASVPSTMSIELSLRPELGAEMSAPIRVVLRDDAGDSWNLDVAKGRGTLDLPQGARLPLILEVEQAGWWAEPTALATLPASGELVILKLWPTGPVSLPATALDASGQKEPLPESRVLFCGCLDEEGDATEPCGEVPVAVEPQGGGYLFELPLDCRDLEVLTADYSAVSYERVEASAVRTIRLEHAVLTRGGSVRGMVRDAASGRPLSGVTVEAAPQFLTCQNRDAVEQLAEGETLELISRVVRTAVTSYRGRFRLTGLEPGDYRLSFSKEGFATLTLREVPARDESDFELADVELGPGSTIEVYSTSAACEGEPFTATISLKQQTISAVAVASLPFRPPVGRAVFSGIAAGSYRLSIRAACGALKPRDLAIEDVEVTARDHVFVPVDLDLPHIQGRVLWDGEPVEASIRLEPLDAMAEVLQFDSSEESGFAVTLPGTGVYRASVTWLSGIFEVDLDLGQEEEVDIEVPANEVTGVVRDHRGEAVAGAVVTAREQLSAERLRLPKVVTTQSDDEGLFEIRSISDGDWEFTAELGERTSRARSEKIGEMRRSVSGVELILKENEEVEVSVVAQSGAPLAGAKVVASWRVPGGSDWSMGSSQVVISDQRGRAALSLPSEVTELRLLATAPGFVATWGEFATAAPIVVRIPAVGGRLELRRTGGNWVKPGLPVAMLLFQGGLVGAQEPMGTLGRGNIGPNSDGKLLTLGPLAPGQYGIVIVEDADDVTRVLQLRGQTHPDMVVTISPGQTTNVDLPF